MFDIGSVPYYYLQPFYNEFSHLPNLGDPVRSWLDLHQAAEA